MMIKNKKIVVLLVIVLLTLIVFLYFYSRKIEQVKLEVVSTEFYPPYVTLGSNPSAITAILTLPDSYQKPLNNQILIQRVTNKVLPVGVLRDDGKNEDKVANDNIYSGKILVRQTVADDVHLRAVALLTRKKKAISDEFSIISGAVVEAGSGGTVKNSEGITISMEAGSVDYPAFLSVKSLPAEAISAPVGKLPLKEVVKVDFRPLDPSLDVGGSTKPLKLVVPAPKKSIGGTFILAKEISVPIANEKTSGIYKRLTPIDTAALNPKNNTIETVTDFYYGIRSSGQYALLANLGSADISGEVCQGEVEPCPANEVKVPSVVVSNSSNTLVAVTDSNGEFQLHISGVESSTISAFDPLRGFTGQADVDQDNLKPEGEDIALRNTFFSSGYDPALTGIRNGGFECVTDNAGSPALCDGFWYCVNNGNQTGCSHQTQGQVEIMQQVALCPRSDSGGFDTECTENTPGVQWIKPSEGDWLLSISTGRESEGKVGSSLSQRIKVPTGATKLYFDYIFLSEEFNEWVGSKYDDSFKATLTPNGQAPINIVDMSINNTGEPDLVPCPSNTSAACLPEVAIFDCGFPGGDRTCGKIPFVSADRDATIQKWRTASVDVSAYAGSNQYLDLTFTANDNGDNIYDTQVLLDNIRFNTVFLDVKVIANSSSESALPGSAANARTDCNSPDQCIMHDLQGFIDSGDNSLRRYGANEILSQAGLNLRLRTNTQENPGQQARYRTVTNDAAFDLNAASLSSPYGPPQYDATPEALTMLANDSSCATENAREVCSANVYYVDTLSYASTSVQGYAFADEDHTNITRYDNDGITISARAIANCGKRGAILAHELGHLLIFESFISSLEHNVADANNFMKGCDQYGDWPGVRPEQKQHLLDCTSKFLADACN